MKRNLKELQKKNLKKRKKVSNHSLSFLLIASLLVIENDAINTGGVSMSDEDREDFQDEFDNVDTEDNFELDEN